MGMKRYLAKRLVHSVFVVFTVVTIVFGAVRAIPGSPVALMLGGDANPEARRALRNELGLNEPIYQQYIVWITDIFQGDLGESILTGRSVTSSLIGVAEPTLSIAGLGILIAILIAVPAGIISAVRRYQTEDIIATFGSFFGISMPSFWIGIILILLVATNVDWIPAFGYTSIDEGIIPWFQSIILPAIAVGYPYGGIIMRQMRSSMLEVLNEDYIRTAHAKGLNPQVILFKHGLQNALIPVVTVAGILLAVVLGGVVAVEIVFGFQGLGRLLINSIQRRDFPVVQGSVIAISVTFVLMNVVVDLLYTLINPRIKYGGGD